MDELPTLICARVIQGGPMVVPGSVREVCSTCGEAVWRAPSSQAVVDAGARIICGRCVQFEVEALARVGVKPKVEPLTADQLAELSALMADGEWYEGKRGPTRVKKGTQIHEAGEHIGFDHPLARELGFRRDLFSGWLWLDGADLYVSTIRSLRPNEGNLTALLTRMLAAGFTVKVPTPFKAMLRILKNHGFHQTWEFEPLANESCEVWVKAAE